jgi:uncharacterized protein (TIGR02596 family)
MRTSPSKNRAFSLIEMIVVILIIGIVAAFVTPAATTMLRGSQLTQATQILTDQIVLARQLALTKNCQVEVRFIKYLDPAIPSDTSSFRALQCFEILESGAAVPMDKPQLMPQAIVMNSGTLSTLLSAASMHTKKADSSFDPELPRKIGHNYEYVSFRFMPDGSTNLDVASGTIWYVTLHNMNDKPTGDTPPKNFFTLQIDPVSGTTKFYRPSV